MSVSEQSAAVDPGFVDVVTPVDFSAAGWRAIPLATSLAAQFAARHRVLHVDVAGPSHEKDASERQVGEPPKVDVEVVAASTPAAGILAALREHRPSLLAMSTHGRSAAAQVALGSVAELVLHSWEGPSVLVGPNYEACGGLRRIVVCVEPAWPPPVQLIADARSWAALFAVPVAVFAVTSGTPRSERAAEAERLAEVADVVSSAGAIGVNRAASGGVASNIIEFADAVPGTLIALAHRNRTRSSRLLLGSAASAVCRRTKSAVLLRRYDAVNSADAG